MRSGAFVPLGMRSLAISDLVAAEFTVGLPALEFVSADDVAVEVVRVLGVPLMPLLVTKFCWRLLKSGKIPASDVAIFTSKPRAIKITPPNKSTPEICWMSAPRCFKNFKRCTM